MLSNGRILGKNVSNMTISGTHEQAWFSTTHLCSANQHGSDSGARIPCFYVLRKLSSQFEGLCSEAAYTRKGSTPFLSVSMVKFIEEWQLLINIMVISCRMKAIYLQAREFLQLIL